MKNIHMYYYVPQPGEKDVALQSFFWCVFSTPLLIDCAGHNVPYCPCTLRVSNCIWQALPAPSSLGQQLLCPRMR